MKKLLISAFLLILTVNCFGGCKNQDNVGERTAAQLKTEIQTSAEAAVTKETKTETQSQTEKQIQFLLLTEESMSIDMTKKGILFPQKWLIFPAIHIGIIMSMMKAATKQVKNKPSKTALPLMIAAQK